MQFLAYTQENLQQCNLMSPEDISENFQESYRQVARNFVTTIKYGTKIHSLIDFILNLISLRLGFQRNFLSVLHENFFGILISTRLFLTLLGNKHNLQEELEDTTEAIRIHNLKKAAIAHVNINCKHH